MENKQETHYALRLITQKGVEFYFTKLQIMRDARVYVMYSKETHNAHLFDSTEEAYDYIRYLKRTTIECRDLEVCLVPNRGRY